MASLAGVGYLLIAQSTNGRDIGSAVVGILSVAASWVTVHTAFTLRYARLYFPDKAIDFNQPGIEPTYADFAYLAFTIGMTYQVSDTTFTTPEFRKAALGHALLSFVFGTAIIATTINFVASLSR